MSQLTERWTPSCVQEDFKKGLTDAEPMTPETAVPPTPTSHAGSTWPAESVAEISDSDDDVIFQGSFKAPAGMPGHNARPLQPPPMSLAAFQAQLQRLSPSMRTLAEKKLRLRMAQISSTMAEGLPEVQILETPPKEPHPKRQVDDVLPVATPVRSSLQAKAKLSEPDTVVTTPVMKHRFSTPGRPLAPSQTSFSRMFFSPAPVVKEPEPERKAPAPVAAAGTAASVPAPVPASVMATKDEKMAKSPESQPATDGSVGETTPVTPVSLHKISAAIFGNRGAVECFRGRVRYRRGPTAKAEATAKAKAKNTKEQVGRPRGKRRNLAVKVVGRKAMAKAKAKSASKAAVMRGKAMKAVSARRRRARPVPEVSREDPMEVVKDQADPADLADPADQAGGRPMRMILAGKDALKTASRKAPEIPPPRIRSAAAAADEGKESEDELPLSRLIEQKAPVSKVPAPTSWSEQLSYPLESAKFPIRIYPMGQAPQDEDDPWSSCSEPEDDDLLDAGKGCVTELVWCRESF